MPCAMSRQSRLLIGAALLVGLLGGTLPAAAQGRSNDAASGVAASGVAATSVENTPGGKGAKVYCFMRAAGK